MSNFCFALFSVAVGLNYLCYAYYLVSAREHSIRRNGGAHGEIVTVQLNIIRETSCHIWR